MNDFHVNVFHSYSIILFNDDDHDGDDNVFCMSVCVSVFNNCVMNEIIMFIIIIILAYPFVVFTIWMISCLCHDMMIITMIIIIIIKREFE